MKLKRQKLLR